MPHVARRGFSLIEVMVVVAIISVVAALAVPNLLPEVHKAHVGGGAEVVAAILGRARGEAMLSKRCVRVWIDSTNPNRIVTERLNSFDCDTTPAKAFPAAIGSVGLDGVNRAWSPLASATLDATSLQMSMTTSPSDTTACSEDTAAPGSVEDTPAGFPCAHLIFRPNGRIWHQDPDISAPDLIPDDAVIQVRHPALAQTKSVLINSNGLICIYKLGQAPIAGLGAGDFVCPP
ncbi:MAG: prepilin-type N-terminal cleavage/methylation domain-containing protein [Deltaproteobacteria bacterium]|nr:prepilin-type N-terminal cleavage/methylation domain-containing protein [Deltaproteobacteria bacterium]